MTKVHTSFEVFAIAKPTNAEFFKNLRTGSKIKITVEIEHSWTVSKATIENLDSKEKIKRGLGELAARLQSFKLKEIKE